MRKFSWVLACLTFATAGLLGACDQQGRSPQPQPPAPATNPDCLNSTLSAAQDAQDLGLTIDVSTYDTNTNQHTWGAPRVTCYTTGEQATVRALGTLSGKGVPDQTLQEIVDDHPNAGRDTAPAILKTYDAFVRDHKENPKLVFYSDHVLGGDDIHALLGGHSLPGQDVASLGTTVTDQVPYTIDQIMLGVNLPDLDPTAGVMQSFLGLQGLAASGCVSSAEDNPSMWESTGDFGFVMNADTIRNPPTTGYPGLGPSTVDDVRVTPKTSPVGPWTDLSFTLKEDLTPDDADLYPMIRAGVHAIYRSFAHTSPTPSQAIFTSDDVPFKTGDTIQPDQDLLKLNPFAGDTNLLVDYTAWAWQDLGTEPYHPQNQSTQLDVLGAKFQPERAQLFPLSPRYRDPMILYCAAKTLQ